MSKPPCLKSKYSKCCRKVRDGTIKEGDPEYEIILAKIKGYTAWQASAGVKVRTTTNTAAVRTLLSQQRHTDQLKVEEKKKLEDVQAKAKAKAEENEAFAKRIEAGNGTPLEEKQLKLKILAEEIRQQKAELELEKARKKAERAATAARPPAAAEQQLALKRAAKRTVEAGTTEAKRRRKDPNATVAPTTETREYKVGEIVKLKSKK